MLQKQSHSPLCVNMFAHVFADDRKDTNKIKCNIRADQRSEDSQSRLIGALRVGLRSARVHKIET